MHTLYPAIKPYASDQLQVDSIHQIYIEECGSPDGIPVLFLHGGPGLGCSEKCRRFFDPEKYRIILFDQRGCGRSTPHGEIEANSTQDLIDDIEKIRSHLKVDKWMLFGGSWGSTLALLYAQAHPMQVKAMILRGIFLSRQQDLDWLYTDQGAARIFPDHWQHFQEIIPENERSDMLTAYHKRLIGDDELARMNAAKHWSLWEGRNCTLKPCPELEERCSEPHSALAISRIEAHFFMNDSFIKPNQIIDNMRFVDQIPGVIVHGRYDMICPLDNAQALSEHWTESELFIVREAGHSSSEPGIVDALILATDKFARKFSSDTA
ncbi:prolyl aminopeptidase [Endozoicomonas sp. OPT23]|uniref:prolyl aminopeptidase n=1 Tax=Endozoicomonas sp. OPT23 TaxID=2072845 RepID=UPI00129B6900|nr:prolyl aminopeptidase [Endozoicomonas sp. OPT23]MRI31959.1 prolyl aminopeptidase [Endozoicomonas sp. OPT23]